MFFKSLSVKNFRGIADLTLRFERDDLSSLRRRTLLVGENGTGKSNVLKAIALVTAGRAGLGDIIGNPDEWISYGADTCWLSAHLRTLPSLDRSVSLLIRRGDTLSDVIRQNEAAFDELDTAIREDTYACFVAGYGVSRRFNRATDAFPATDGLVRSDRALSVATLFDADATLHPLTAWAMELDHRYGSQGVAMVKDALDDLLPNVQFNGIDRARSQLLFQIGAQLVPLHLLSDGHQAIAAWIGDLLYRISNPAFPAHSPLEARGLLLIEEIDLHLHPKGQRVILDYIGLKFPNFQIIATTHSSLTAQQAGGSELYFLQRNEVGHVELHEFKGAPNQMLVSQLLLSPAFDVPTDESTVVAQLKEEYRTLKQRKSDSPADHKRLRELTQTLSNLPQTQRSNSPIEADQLALIADVRNELLRRKKST